jgi:hypothetical protein
LLHADHDQVYGDLAAILTERTTGEWLELCEAHQIPASLAPTLDDIVNDPALHRDVLDETAHPVVGSYRMIRPAVTLSATPASVRRPAPLVGEHTAEILAEAGYSEAEILAEAGYSEAEIAGLVAGANEGRDALRYAPVECPDPPEPLYAMPQPHQAIMTHVGPRWRGANPNNVDPDGRGPGGQGSLSLASWHESPASRRHRNAFWCGGSRGVPRCGRRRSPSICAS